MRHRIPVRLLSIAAAGLLALFASACGSSGSGGDTTQADSGATAAKVNPMAAAAVDRYETYLADHAAELTAETKPFVAAVVASDLARAKSLYGPSRTPYERIEPVAETFGSLDPRIDARENDVPANRFEGFHRIEKALWEEGTTQGMAPVAERLQADVEELQAKVDSQIILRAEQVAAGANGLLSEVSASKITGEEERYSHIDLVDFEANVEGAEAAWEAVAPMVRRQDPELAREIEADFEVAFAGLEPYRRGAGFVLYPELTKADTRKLSQQIDALAEKLSQVPAVVYRFEH